MRHLCEEISEGAEPSQKFKRLLFSRMLRRAAEQANDEGCVSMSDATKLRDRFAEVRLITSGKLRDLIDRHQWSAAQALGEKLGIPISRGVIDLQARRART